MSQLKDGTVRTYNIAPEDFGLKRATLADIKGGDVFDNTRIVRKVLKGRWLSMWKGSKLFLTDMDRTALSRQVWCIY
ncbi:MAG: hypothetical protein WC600_05885 [Desulfobaccales bacterium]